MCCVQEGFDEVIQRLDHDDDGSVTEEGAVWLVPAPVQPVDLADLNRCGFCAQSSCYGGPRTIQPLSKE
eukprot:COSAG06_NODE_78_length_25492_cov_189.998307_14_plen_69_part_00